MKHIVIEHKALKKIKKKKKSSKMIWIERNQFVKKMPHLLDSLAFRVATFTSLVQDYFLWSGPLLKLD